MKFKILSLFRKQSVIPDNYIPYGHEGSSYDQIQTAAVLAAREKQLKVKNGYQSQFVKHRSN